MSKTEIARIWVVEKLEDGAWMPTGSVRFTRQEARDACSGRRRDNPYDQFRVREYTRYE